MALSGKFISFEPIIESVYRKAGYQTVDWAEALEVIGETIRLIGALPAYEEVTTNGQGTNPIPLEVVDYRTALPNDIIKLTTLRKVELKEIVEDGETNLVIAGVYPMVETTDLFYKTATASLDNEIPGGTFDYVAFKQRDILTLSGTSGTADITLTGGLTAAVTFATDLATTAANFVTANYDAYEAVGVLLSNDVGNDYIIFTSEVSGTNFISPAITNTGGDLSGSVADGSESEPIQVIGQGYKKPMDYIPSYKINNNYIYTNFKDGFIELVYTAFVKDASGFPMIPDDQRYIEAIRWSIIEHIDYKRWRVGDIPDKVYDKSEQNRCWYIASAKTKSDIPSVDKMESIKEMFLRSIPKTRMHDTYFKYGNIGEIRYNNNSRSFHSGFNRGY